MKDFFISLFFLTLLFPAISPSVLPRADTPQFYLVSSSTNSATNLLPVRFKDPTGGFATLTGTNPAIQFFFLQGKLVAVQPGSGGATLNSWVNAVPQGSCSTWGALLLFSGSSTNKCLTPGNFQIQSDTMNAQLGAFLTNNYVGGFFTCGTSNDIYYRLDSTGPPGLTCTPVNLFTVPVT